MQKRILIFCMFNNMLVFVSFVCVLIPMVLGDHSINVCIFKKPQTNEKEAAKELFEMYEQLFNNFQEFIENGTYFIDIVNFDLHHPAISIKGNLSNTTISHLDEYDLEIFEWVDIFKPRFQIFSLKLYNVSLEGTYNIPVGNIGDLFAIYGAGPFWLNIENFTIAASGRFVINETATCVPTDVTVTASSASNYFHHFMGDEEMEELMNKAITFMLPQAVGIIWQDILGWNGQKWEEYINDFINNRKILLEDHEYQERN